MRIKLVLTGVAMLVMATIAYGVPPGKTVEWKTSLGTVTFSGDVHTGTAKLQCTDCHPKPFQMKSGATKMTMAEINAGQFCGQCHNGEKAFKANDPANCMKCHKMGQK